MTAVLDRPADGHDIDGERISADETGPTDRERAYQLRMTHSGHRILTALDAEPAPSLREFAGQPDAPYRRPDWFDHPRLWLDHDLVEVLSVEPYCDVRDPAVAQGIAADLAGLPLLLDGPHPGVWNSSTTLLLLRRDPARPAPRSYADEFADAVELVGRLVAAELAAGEQLIAALDPPTVHSLRGLVAAVLADPTLLRWAAERLASHVLVGHLPAEQAVTLLANTVQATGRDDRAEPLFWAAWVEQARKALGAAHDEVRGLLGSDFRVRLAAVRGFPGIADVPGLALVDRWLGEIETSEVYG